MQHAIYYPPILDLPDIDECYPNITYSMRDICTIKQSTDTIYKSQIQLISSGRIINPQISDFSLLISNSQVTDLILNAIINLTLEVLDISNNNIRQIPDIISLRILKCNKSNVYKLPDCLPNLQELQADDNYIQLIPRYPKLQKLSASDNLVTSLSNYTHSILQHISINNNPITGINIPSACSIQAINCPLLEIGLMPLLNKKSSIITNNKLQWITIRNIKHNSSLVIDWNTYHARKLPKLLSNSLNLIFNV